MIFGRTHFYDIMELKHMYIKQLIISQKYNDVDFDGVKVFCSYYFRGAIKS